jgi:hypothetical protein
MLAACLQCRTPRQDAMGCSQARVARSLSHGAIGMRRMSYLGGRRTKAPAEGAVKIRDVAQGPDRAIVPNLSGRSLLAREAPRVGSNCPRTARPSVSLTTTRNVGSQGTPVMCSN